MCMKKTYLLTTLLAASIAVSAQTPGGVSTGLKQWVKANASTALDTNVVNFGLDTVVNIWTYSNDGTKTYTASGNARPKLRYNTLNFLPTLEFDGGGFLQGPTGSNAPLTAGDDDYSVFAVWFSSSASSYQRVWTQKNSSFTDVGDGAALATWNDGRYGHQIEKSPYDHTIQRAYTANTWRISQLNLLNQATNDLEIIDNGNLSSGGTAYNTDPLGVDGAALRTLVTSFNHIGARNGQYDEALTGNVAEIIIYENSISSTDRSKIFSYLALKYGINIATSFLASDATTIWDATANASFNNDVFGIGLDNGSGLSAASANSINNGTGAGNGISGRGNIVLSNPSALADLEFMLTGHNSGALTEISTDLPVTATGSQRLVREWKIQHTGNVGTINLSFDLAGITTTGVVGTVTDFKLMVDEDGDGDFTTGTVSFYTPANFTGTRMNFAGITLNNNVVYSFITKALGALPVSWKSFEAKATGDNVSLSWSVSNNADADYYEVEHAADGINFQTVGKVSNSAAVSAYNFTHNNVTAGKNHYRIRQVDENGRATYSKVVDVTVKGDAFGIKLLSNPVRTAYAELEITAPKADVIVTELWSVAGNRIATAQQIVVAGKNRVRVPMDRASTGNYIIKVKVGDTNQTIQVVKL